MRSNVAGGATQLTLIKLFDEGFTNLELKGLVKLADQYSSVTIGEQDQTIIN